MKKIFAKAIYDGMCTALLLTTVISPFVAFNAVNTIVKASDTMIIEKNNTADVTETASDYKAVTAFTKNNKKPRLVYEDIFKQFDDNFTADSSADSTEYEVNVGEVRYFYDEIKDDDFIEKPFYYGYSYELSAEERELVQRIVMHEAGWCPDYRLLILTAQCVRNDCELNDWRPFEVFDKCGYAAMDYINPRAIKAVKDVFDIGIKCVDEKIFCYYNSNLVDSPYHESNKLAIDIDGNRFFY